MEGCDQIDLTYGPPPDDEAAFDEWLESDDWLDVYLLPLDCALDYDDTPFAVGDFGPALRAGGRPAGGAGGHHGGPVRHHLRRRPARHGGSLQPFDLDAEIERIAEEGGGGAFFPL